MHDEFNYTNKLSKEDCIALIESDEFESETQTQKRIRLLREHKQNFNKNLKSFIGGVR